MGDVVQNPRDQAAADDQHQGDEGTNPDESDAESAPDRAWLQPREQRTPFPLVHRLAAHQPGKRRDEDERKDHGEVLDNEPAHGNAPALGLNEPSLLQDAQHDYGARHRERQSEDDARPPAPSEALGQAEAEEGHKTDLPDGPRHSDAADGQEVLQREVQPDAEHEQDDTNFGELWRQGLISNKPRRERSDQNPCHKISDKRREPEAVGEHAADESKPETSNDGGNQGRVMRHQTSSYDCRAWSLIWVGYRGSSIDLAEPRAVERNYARAGLKTSGPEPTC